LVRRAQHHGGAATVGLAGVLLPGLRRAVSPLTRACPSRADDLEAEALAVLVEAIGAFPVGRDRVAARLLWPAIRAAHRLLAADQAWRAQVELRPVVQAPAKPGGHPDLVLVRAVREGALTVRDAELIGQTRLGGIRLGDLAVRQGVSYAALAKRRQRAERALLAWLTSELSKRPA
jgi:hypothetical protein